MAKMVLKALDVSEILSILASRLGKDQALGRTMAILREDPKKDTVTIFTDTFGNIDVKPA